MWGDDGVMQNVHQRELPTSQDRLGELLDQLASPAEPLWPRRWPPLPLDRSLAPGATGGHGPIRYTVIDYQPGQRVVFRFERPTPLDGTHALEVLPGSAPGTAVLRHAISGRLLGLTGRVGWPLVIRWLHDALIEDLLDRAAGEVGDPPARAAQWSPWVRLWRRLLRTTAPSPT
jgi:hypothetical protein